MSIEITHLHKRYGDFVALNDVSLTVKPGEMMALLGPSGSGKTTLLRMIAGMDTPDAGTVRLNGEAMQNRHAKDRRVGFVFQHYALFKHMTVFENVAFGLRVRPKTIRPTPMEIMRKVMRLLKLVHLDQFHDRYPHQLSGGQRQRVALARALAVEPSVLLLDEPFGALDAKVRKELRRWMRRLHDEMHFTSVFVTHDQEEAMEVADRVVVMSQGRIEQVGTPEDVWHSPRNAFVYDFLGNYNEFEGWQDDAGALHLVDYDVRQEQKLLKAPGTAATGWLARYPEVSRLVSRFLPARHAPSVTEPVVEPRKSGKGRAVRLFARPHEMFVTRTADAHEYITAQVVHINPAGPLVRLELERVGGSILEAEIPKDVVDSLNIRKLDSVLVRPKNVRVFEAG